jgi:hypothetical protein
MSLWGSTSPPPSISTLTSLPPALSLSSPHPSAVLSPPRARSLRIGDADEEEDDLEEEEQEARVMMMEWEESLEQSRAQGSNSSSNDAENSMRIKSRVGVPLFRITAEDDPTHPIVTRSPADAWRVLCARRERARARASSSSASTDPHAIRRVSSASDAEEGDVFAFGLSGAVFFGLGHPAVVEHLERLPMARRCRRYQLRFKPCARCASDRATARQLWRQQAQQRSQQASALAAAASSSASELASPSRSTSESESTQPSSSLRLALPDPESASRVDGDTYDRRETRLERLRARAEARRLGT